MMRTGRNAVCFAGIYARNGALGKIRTPDPQIRSLVLYPAELPAPVSSSGTLKVPVGEARKLAKA